MKGKLNIMNLMNRIAISGAALLMLESTSIGVVTAKADSINNVNEEMTIPDKYISISNSQILNALKENNPEAYAKIPVSERTALLRQDMLRQGGTYIKTNSTGFTVYLNSAIVKTAKLAGMGAVAWAIASVAATAGLTAGPTAAISTVVGGLIGQVPDGRGVWAKLSNEGSLVTWGLQ